MGLGFVMAVSPDRAHHVLSALPTGRIVGTVAETTPNHGLRVCGLTEDGVSDA
jgi:hypothetical protein